MEGSNLFNGSAASMIGAAGLFPKGQPLSMQTQMTSSLHTQGPRMSSFQQGSASRYSSLSGGGSSLGYPSDSESMHTSDSDYYP